MDLSVSIVTFAPNWTILERTLASLRNAGAVLGRLHLFIVNNGPSDTGNELSVALARVGLEGRVISGHGNIGYGSGHNLGLDGISTDFHLILNPDVEILQDTLVIAFRFMEQHPECGLLVPAVLDNTGNYQYLCKRYPSVIDLFLRGFAPGWLKSIFRKRLDYYEMRDMVNGHDVVWDPLIVSGCFMLFRTEVLKQFGGFDSRYFLYFEDFDLSLRIAKVARIAYVPSVRITHFGGNASKKGWWHIGMFARSAVTFFNRHGWKWW